MKKYNIIIFAALLLLVNACKKEFLDTVKIGEQTSSSFYSNDDEITKAANACYAPMWEYHYNWARTDLESYTTDETVRREPYGFNDFTFDASQFLFLYNYRYNYRGILIANQLISHVEGKDIPGVKDKELQKRVVGEAKYMRAYYYYDLVKNYGDVPLVDHPLLPNEMNLERSSAKDIYSFIEADLKAAAEVLPVKSAYIASNNVGRATKGAALAMLVKVCVSQASPGFSGQDFYNSAKYSEAKTYAQQLFNLGEYSLYHGNYHDIFTEAGENGSGSIFEVQFYDSPLDDGAYTDNGNFTTFLNMPWFGAGDPYGEYQVTYDLYLAFEAGDPRRDASVINTVQYADQWILPGETPGVVTGDLTGFYNYKHYLSKQEYTSLGNPRNSPINERIIRLSDIYLLYAEACYNTGDEGNARLYLNYVRERARNGNSAVLPNVTASGSALLDDIYHERRVELCNEGHRWYDLVRTGRLEQIVSTNGYKVKANVTRDGSGGYIITDSGNPVFHATNLSMPKNMFFPIPQSEIDNSNGKVTQNTGY